MRLSEVNVHCTFLATRAPIPFVFVCTKLSGSNWRHTNYSHDVPRQILWRHIATRTNLDARVVALEERASSLRTNVNIRPKSYASTVRVLGAHVIYLHICLTSKLLFEFLLKLSRSHCIVSFLTRFVSRRGPTDTEPLNPPCKGFDFRTRWSSRSTWWRHSCGWIRWRLTSTNLG